MKSSTIVIILCFLNLIAAGSLSLVTSKLYWLLLMVINIFLLVRRRWSRILVFIAILGSFAAMTYSLVLYIMDFDALENPSIILAPHIYGLMYAFYSFFILNSKNIKNFYQSKKVAIPLIGEGWNCPKCHSYMKFSIACWNCGFTKEA